MTLAWKVGFEVELVAPKSASRADLARAVAGRIGGKNERFFHPQSEPSAVAGTPVFESLTLGFRVRDTEGRPVASFVDDITLQRDLDQSAPPIDGWYRIVSDDARLLQLIIRLCDPDATLEAVLGPLAGVFGTEVQRHGTGMVKVNDMRNVSVALGAPLPGERQRGCEIVTAPLEADHETHLDLLLTEAVRLGFALPWEGATHIHFDATRLKNANAIVNLARLFGRHGAMIKRLVGTNPNCVRIGNWPAGFFEATAQDDFLGLDWPEARDALHACGLTKYCDFNLANIVAQNPTKDTFEVRVLPSMLDAGAIVRAAEFFAALLDWCAETPAALLGVPDSFALMLGILPLDPAAARYWQDRAGAAA